MCMYGNNRIMSDRRRARCESRADRRWWIQDGNGVDLETTGGPEGETLIDWLSEDGRNEMTRVNEQDNGERRGRAKKKKKKHKRQKCKETIPHSASVYYVNCLDRMKHALNYNDIGGFTCYTTLSHEMLHMLCKTQTW